MRRNRKSAYPVHPYLNFVALSEAPKYHYLVVPRMELFTILSRTLSGAGSKNRCREPCAYSGLRCSPQ
jgi:hypothetical protein